MFNRPKKKSNLQDFLLPGSPKNDEKTDISSYEPANKKKIKPNSAVHTTANITNDYKNAVEEITSDLKYKSKPELIGKTNDAAFHYNEIDTDYTQDAKAIALKNIRISQEIKSGKLDKKFYKGMNGYAEYNEKSDNSIRSSKFTGSLGPIRAPKHIRVTCRFDYNPSLCKDWHDTGSCVFGDSCIYIHDRGDYKSGWELEKEWEEEQKKKAKNNGHLSDIDTDNEDPSENIVIPEVCPICEKPFTHPIITNCEHFFCEKCALNNYSKSPNCFVCKRPTNGTFNDGLKVIKKLKEAKQAVQKEQNSKKTKKKDIEELVHELDLPEIDEKEKIKLLEGIEFDNNNNNNNNTKNDNENSNINSVNTNNNANNNTNNGNNDDHELQNLAGEFKKKRAKQKAQIKYESDWLLE